MTASNASQTPAPVPTLPDSVRRRFEQQVKHADTRAVLLQVTGALRLAADRAAAHLDDPARYPLPADAAALERVVLGKLQGQPQAVRQSAAAMARTRLQAPQPQRESDYGIYAALNIATARSTLDLARAMPLPAPLQASASRAGLHALVQPLPLTERGKQRRPRRPGPLQRAPAEVPRKVELVLHSVSVGKTTEERGRDEIAVAASAFDMYNRAEASLAPVNAGKFRDPKNGQRDSFAFDPPRQVASFDIQPDALFGTSYEGTIYLAEQDFGGFNSFITQHRALSGAEMRQAQLLFGTVLAGSLLGIPVGAALGGLGAAPSGPAGIVTGLVAGAGLGAVLGGLVGAVAALVEVLGLYFGGLVLNWVRDDVFAPQPVGVALDEEGRIAGSLSSGRQSAVFTGFGATYNVSYEWRVRLGAPLPVSPLPPYVPAPETTDKQAALDNLLKIKHIVVVMLENRSYDHMLGFLTAEQGRAEADGVTPTDPQQSNDEHDGDGNLLRSVAPRVLEQPRFVFDPGHSVRNVKRQLFGDAALVDVPEDQMPFGPGIAPTMSGFVDAFRDPTGNGQKDAALIMGYHPAKHVPSYDLLAREFAVCKRWYSSFPGNTWVNRCYALTGRPDITSDGSLRIDNDFPINVNAFVRQLDADKVDWRWYSQDIPSLLVVDSGMAAKVGQGRFRTMPRFLKDAAEGKLPQVAWLDPNFMDVATIREDLNRIGVQGLEALATEDDFDMPSFITTANDDHPPTDVMHGQNFVFEVFKALFTSPQWDETLLVITYDEHGGFHDHVPPPPVPEDVWLEETRDPAGGQRANAGLFRYFGARVPALVVSPHVARSMVSEAQFDHASILRTIFLRFCPQGDAVPAASARVRAAEHLGRLLCEPKPRFSVKGDAVSRSAMQGDAALAQHGMREAAARSLKQAAPARELTELEEQMNHVRRTRAAAWRRGS